MRLMIAGLQISLLLWLWEPGRADDPISNSDRMDSGVRRMEVMKSRIMALSVDGESGAKHFGEEPILRYSDPTRRITDASVTSNPAVVSQVFCQ